MACFALNNEFNNFEEVLQAKKSYESEKNVILVIRNSHKLIGEGELVKRMIYSRLSLHCKAGRERPTESKGLRMSSTFKKNCPMKINIVFKNNKLKVSSVNDVHENHQLNVQTYRHYPEAMRLSKQEEEKATFMLAADGKKAKIKSHLMAERMEQGNETPVMLKSIHNLQTKVRLGKEKLHVGENELQRLLDSMLKVVGAKVEVLSDENNELCCIYYQDSRMMTMFDKYPELLLFDATYKMNNREMPLFIQSVVDGNGITEIVSLAICRSESRIVIEFILRCFKKFNLSWEKIKCVIGDKDFADRVVYTEMFVGVALQICLFHVLRTFNREITTSKRDITKEQRDNALGILQKLCYAHSEEYYDEQYEKLRLLNLEKVMDYFDSNWHTIREEWTLFGRNEYSNYLNSTNNRSETMNQKLKMIGTRNANLLSFFENISTSVTVLSSEKDIRAVRLDMRTIRIRFEDMTLRSYHDLLTPFIFNKIYLEFEMLESVNFASTDGNTGLTNYGRTVTISKCSCAFKISMNLPCRHILKFRKQNEIDLFAPELCARRWTKQYYKESHPALQMNENIPTAVPMYIQKVRVPQEKDKYNTVASVSKEITSLVSTMVTGEFTFYLEKLKALKNQITAPPIFGLVGENEDMLPGVACTSANVGAYRNVQVRNEEMNTYQSDVLDLSLPKIDINTNINGQEIENGSSPMIENGSSQISVNISASSQAVREIILPYKRKSVGRPKGSLNTVIGTKRKKTSKSSESTTTHVKMTSTVPPSNEIGQPKRSKRILKQMQQDK